MKELILNGSEIISQIYIGRGIIQQISDLCLPKEPQSMEHNPSKICVITDTNVAPLYLDTIMNSFSNLDVSMFSHIIEAGEGYKTLETVSNIYDTLCLAGFGRNDMIVALGGGVVGDIAGFVTATFLRGIKHLVQIPTTLLAQVDSSVGGKCGVDLPHGKNLVGAFRQPNKVVIDVEVLNTLSQGIYASGMAEVIKYGCIWNPSILDMVSGVNKKIDIEEIIIKCVGIKIQVVEEDETEEGIRRILNFGHTIGHSIEKLGGFTKFSHGEAVAIGMASAVKMGERIGITQKGRYDELMALLQSYDLPTKIPYPIDQVFDAIMSDKKKQGDSIYFIYIEDFGKIKIEKTAVNQLKQIMKVLDEEQDGKYMG